MSGYSRVYSEKLFEAIQTLPERELRLWLALVAYANNDALCWPGIAALSAITGYRQEIVGQLLDALSEKGFIEFIRRGQRDPYTKQMMNNVYQIDGIVTSEGKTDEKADSAFELENGVITPPRTDSITNKDSTRQRTPPPTQQTASKMASPKDKSEETAKPKTERKREEKTPERSSIPPNPVPPTPSPRPDFYTGPLDEWAEPLPDVQEQAAVNLNDRVDRKLPLRLARKYIAEYGQDQVNIALAHMAKQTNIHNPPGYLRTLLERQAVEAADAEPVDPGLKYITGPYADYISH